MNVLICGHVDITEQQFNDFYIPDIEAFLNAVQGSDVTFYVGGATGTDSFAQDYLYKQGYKMVVCDRRDENNAKYTSDNISHVNGFESYTARDAHMISQCYAIILFLRNEPRSLGSGSMRNFLSGVIDAKTAQSFFEHARSQEWESVSSCLDAFEHADLFTDKIRDAMSKILVL